MLTPLKIVTLFVFVLLFSCSSSSKKKDFKHNYTKYWDKYTDEQLMDTLYSDTLSVGSDVDGGVTARSFYKNTIKELISDLKDDNYKLDSLYPMTAFDKLIIKKIPFGFSKTLTNKQTTRFLEIINDPVSFNWSETTYEPEFQLEFYNDNESVAILTIGADRSIIKTVPDWPAYKKMKFGGLRKDSQKALIKLLNEIGI